MKKNILSIATAIIISLSVYSQNANISISFYPIIDYEYEEACINGTQINFSVLLNGESIEQTSVDFFEEYSLENIEPGTYEIITDCAGFRPKTISNIIIDDKYTTILDIELEPVICGISDPIEVNHEEMLNDGQNIYGTFSVGFFSEESFQENANFSKPFFIEEGVSFRYPIASFYDIGFESMLYYYSTQHTDFTNASMILPANATNVKEKFSYRTFGWSLSLINRATFAKNYDKSPILFLEYGVGYALPFFYNEVQRTRYNDNVITQRTKLDKQGNVFATGKIGTQTTYLNVSYRINNAFKTSEIMPEPPKILFGIGFTFGGEYMSTSF